MKKKLLVGTVIAALFSTAFASTSNGYQLTMVNDVKNQKLQPVVQDFISKVDVEGSRDKRVSFGMIWSPVQQSCSGDSCTYTYAGPSTKSQGWAVNQYLYDALAFEFKPTTSISDFKITAPYGFKKAIISEPTLEGAMSVGIGPDPKVGKSKIKTEVAFLESGTDKKIGGYSIVTNYNSTPYNNFPSTELNSIDTFGICHYLEKSTRSIECDAGDKFMTNVKVTFSDAK